MSGEQRARLHQALGMARSLSTVYGVRETAHMLVQILEEVLAAEDP